MATAAQALQRAYGHAIGGFVVDTALALFIFLIGDLHQPWLFLVVPLCMRASALIACACTYTVAFGMGVGWSMWQADVPLTAPWAHVAFGGVFVLFNALPWRYLASLGVGFVAAACVLCALWSVPTVVPPPQAIVVALVTWVVVGLLLTLAKPRLLTLR